MKNDQTIADKDVDIKINIGLVDYGYQADFYYKGKLVKQMVRDVDDIKATDVIQAISNGLKTL